MPQKTTKKCSQNSVFWGLWSQAKAALRQAHLTDEEIETERQAVLEMAGAQKDVKGRYSMTSLSPAKMNTALDLIEVNILGRPNKKRGSQSIIWSINKIKEETPNLTEGYLNKIASDTYNKDDWRTLTKPQLTTFRFTIINRAKELREKSNE